MDYPLQRGKTLPTHPKNRGCPDFDAIRHLVVGSAARWCVESLLHWLYLQIHFNLFDSTCYDIPSRKIGLPPPKKRRNSEFENKQHLMVSSGARINVVSSLYYRYSQVHSDLEWWYLLWYPLIRDRTTPQKKGLFWVWKHTTSDVSSGALVSVKSSLYWHYSQVHSDSE